MYSFLLVIIYVAFISLGLPDSLLGSGWPVMHGELGVPISYAGIITMIIAGGTIISSLLSSRLTHIFGAGLVTAISVFLTAAALFGFSFAKEYWMLCVLAIPYGLGAGAVDAALNNYVALHYKSRHMSWLHCFWGVGASLSPYIMGYSLTGTLGWSGGYRIVSIIQISLTVILFVTLPLWKIKKKNEKQLNEENLKTQKEKSKSAEERMSFNNAFAEERVPMGTIPAEIPKEKPKGLIQTLKIKGLPLMLISFFAYCALESTSMLWASSYLVQFRAMKAETAAMLASLFFLGITSGRFISGFISEKLGDKRLIRIGISVILCGVILIAIPDKYNICSMAGLVVAGLGCAPVYPSIIHSTPANFGKENSHSVIGIQMASAYLGATFMPPLFGLIAQYVNIGLLPVYLFFFLVLLVVMSELLNKTIAKNNRQRQNEHM